MMVLHLQFANDTIMFLKAKMENVHNMELCLPIFEAISGLKVNMMKSSTMGILVEEMGFGGVSKWHWLLSGKMFL